jgi:gamma-glutamyltranspeptidase/glutathione hydrolase
MTVGAAGGPKIITSVLLAILRRLDFDQSLADAVGSPRIHQQWMPDVLTVEKKMPKEIVEQLEAKGHKIDLIDSGAVAQAIEVDDKGQFIGVHDRRVPGKAASGKRPK